MHNINLGCSEEYQDFKRKYQEAGETCIMGNSVIRNATKYFSVDEFEDSELRRTCSMRCTNGKSTQFFL
jgi:hypothetical protein